MFDDAFDTGDAETEVVDAGEFDADVEFERSPACDTGLTELGELRSRAEKSTGDCALLLNPPKSWSSDSRPDVGGLFVVVVEALHPNDVIGVGCESLEGGEGASVCIVGDDRSYGDGSANDMNIGLLAIVLYGLTPLGWSKL